MTVSLPPSLSSVRSARSVCTFHCPTTSLLRRHLVDICELIMFGQKRGPIKRNGANILARETQLTKTKIVALHGYCRKTKISLNCMLWKLELHVVKTCLIGILDIECFTELPVSKACKRYLCVSLKCSSIICTLYVSLNCPFPKFAIGMWYISLNCMFCKHIILLRMKLDQTVEVDDWSIF